MTAIARAMIGERVKRTLRGSMVHHGNRGRWTSSGAGSTHRAYDWGRISGHPPVTGNVSGNRSAHEAHAVSLGSIQANR